jgi:hypothetical protein
VFPSYPLHYRGIFKPVITRNKAVPIAGCYVTSWIPYVIGNRLTDGEVVASVTGRTHFTSQKDPRYSFLLGAKPTPRDPSPAERIWSIENHLLARNGTYDLPACSDGAINACYMTASGCMIVN